jgi:ribonuclease E
MANKMLIDATHPEETRVVVLRGNRVEEFDFESANRKQLRGNIYLAKVTRVEPSLQAAFVDYGGNRHGFLAFSEIHPDYYQIPVADRQALIDEEERAHRDAEAEADRRAGGGGGGGGGGRHRHHHRSAGRGRDRDRDTVQSEPIEGAAEGDIAQASDTGTIAQGGDITADLQVEPMGFTGDHHNEADHGAAPGAEAPALPAETVAPRPDATAVEASAPLAALSEGIAAGEAADATDHRHDDEEHADPGHAAHEAHQGEPVERAREDNGDSGDEPEGDGEEEEIVESVGGSDVMEEVPDRMPRLRRQYKIQEVIKRRQIMLVQVVKEERGTKGAALTTYLSLAGRYSVLMPNTARGGGISRKITNFIDRKRLKEIAQELEVPEGMGVILRTAGAARTKTEIKRDFEYLLRLWETVRDVTLNSTAPTLVYEEGSLVKRSIRDLYNKDIDEVIVAGEAYKEARDFMRMLMPSHAANVKPYRESQPILTRYGIESQLDAMFSPIVQLRSGGYIVINQAEALVAIDVNSGRATREHHIEDTALKTNLEAADEVARQLRLRDLAGLIVIDFIDMDEKRNNRAVERRMKECLKHDRARIQVGRISHFGLLEMSRQRIRTSVLESSTDKCPHCGGTGHVRSVASVALQVLRMIEETLLRGATHNLIVRTRSDIAIYVLNHKRAHLRELEERFRIVITINADAAMGGQTPFLVERGEQVHSIEQARAIAAAQPVLAPLIEPEEELEPIIDEVDDEEVERGGASESAGESDDDEDDEEFSEAAPGGGESRETGTNGDGDGDGDGVRRRRRRRRRGRRGEPREGGPITNETAPEHAVAHDDEGGSDEAEPSGHDEPQAGAGEPREHAPSGNGDGNSEADRSRRRRRGRRGGRRNRRDREGGEGEERFSGEAPQGAIEPELIEAVADFGGPPVVHQAVEADTPREREPEPFSAPPREDDRVHSHAPAEPAAAEPPRRRSTVREPAPVAFDDGAAAPAEATMPQPMTPAHAPAAPVAQEQPQESADKPRRTGWWAKRMLGG